MNIYVAQYLPIYFYNNVIPAVTVPGHLSHQCNANQSNPSQLIQFSHRSCQTKLAPLHFSTKKWHDIENKKVQVKL